MELGKFRFMRLNYDAKHMRIPGLAHEWDCCKTDTSYAEMLPMKLSCGVRTAMDEDSGKLSVVWKDGILWTLREITQEHIQHTEITWDSDRCFVGPTPEYRDVEIYTMTPREFIDQFVGPEESHGRGWHSCFRDDRYQYEMNVLMNRAAVYKRGSEYVRRWGDFNENYDFTWNMSDDEDTEALIAYEQLLEELIPFEPAHICEKCGWPIECGDERRVLGTDKKQDYYLCSRRLEDWLNAPARADDFTGVQCNAGTSDATGD